MRPSGGRVSLLRAELVCKAFIAKTLRSMGLHVEPLENRVGRLSPQAAFIAF
jgi:hypothetical protein